MDNAYTRRIRLYVMFCQLTEVWRAETAITLKFLNEAYDA